VFETIETHWAKSEIQFTHPPSIDWPSTKQTPEGNIVTTIAKTRTFKPVKFTGIDVINAKKTEFTRHFVHPNSAGIWNERF